MAHLDVASYFTQYIWVLFSLFCLFWNLQGILSVLQYQIVLRAWCETRPQRKRIQSEKGGLILGVLVSEKW